MTPGKANLWHAKARAYRRWTRRFDGGRGITTERGALLTDQAGRLHAKLDKRLAVLIQQPDVAWFCRMPEEASL